MAACSMLDNGYYNGIVVLFDLQGKQLVSEDKRGKIASLPLKIG